MPYGADETVYPVVDSFGARGSVYRETEIERADHRHLRFDDGSYRVFGEGDSLVIEQHGTRLQ